MANECELGKRLESVSNVCLNELSLQSRRAPFALVCINFGEFLLWGARKYYFCRRVRKGLASIFKLSKIETLEASNRDAAILVEQTHLN